MSEMWQGNVARGSDLVADYFCDSRDLILPPMLSDEVATVR